MPENLTAVWGDVASFFSTALSSGLETVTAVPLLIAPTIIGVGGMIIGSVKSLLRTRRGRR